MVFGFYGHRNLGDDLFKEVFVKLFPELTFKFVDYLTVSDVQEASAIFFGGGSFLNQFIPMAEGVKDLIITKPIFYIGVGTETDIYPQHKELLSLAKLIAIRTPTALAKIKELNSNVMIIPDLVYYLSGNVISKKERKGILILPNISILPTHQDANWKHTSWNYFKSEMSQLLDELINKKIDIKFFPMCTDKKLNDIWAATETLNQMRHRDEMYLLPTTSSYQQTIDLFSKYQLIITQRYHGAILSAISQTSAIVLSHHDKLSSFYPSIPGSILSYYGINKNILSENINNYLQNTNKMSDLPIDFNIFEEMKQKILQNLD